MQLSVVLFVHLWSFTWDALQCKWIYTNAWMRRLVYRCENKAIARGNSRFRVCSRNTHAKTPMSCKPINRFIHSEFSSPLAAIQLLANSNIVDSAKCIALRVCSPCLPCRPKWAAICFFLIHFIMQTCI